jgi:hypothetical protein
MGDGRILKEQAHAAEDLGDPEASRPARPRERERADQRERLKGAEKLAGAPTVRERPDGGMRPGDEEKGEQRWQPWQAAARCAQHTHRHPAVRARRAPWPSAVGGARRGRIQVDDAARAADLPIGTPPEDCQALAAVVRRAQKLFVG